VKKALVPWSSGKDSAWALHQLRQSNEYEIVGLLTTINTAFDRVAMHGTRREVLEAQAEAAGLPLWMVPLPWPCSNAEYEAAMSAACRRAIAAGIEDIAFGDLYLEDVRRYREERLAGTGLQPIFPLWGINTAGLVRMMLRAGVRARIVCVDPKKLPKEFAGRDLDDSLLERFPPEIDPCAENGEFHTCAYAGPIFRKAIAIESGEVVERDGFVFADVKLADVKLAPDAVGASGAGGR
jgi:uncharacterized protein (TIGR00290 family)